MSAHGGVDIGDVIIQGVDQVDLEVERERQRNSDIMSLALLALKKSEQTLQPRKTMKRASKDGVADAVCNPSRPFQSPW
eukprot:1204616-Pyramimonas_sp.AAC.1